MKHQCTLTKNNNKKKKKKIELYFYWLILFKNEFCKSKIIFREKILNLKKCILYIYEMKKSPKFYYI